MEMIWYIVKMALIFVAAQFVLAPFVLYFVNKHAARPQFQSFDLLNPPLLLPPSYTQNIALLEELGFHPVAHLFGAGHATTVRYVLTLFVNESEKDTANVAHMLSEVPPITRKVVNYVEFGTEFQDGSEVCTNNVKLPSGFVQVPEKKIIRMPHITEPNQLYAVHRAALAQRSPEIKKLVPAGEEVSDLIATMQRDLAREASFGRLRLDHSGLWYRLTVKSAILYSLKFNWPVGSLRRHFQRWQGKRLADALLHKQ
jgi:hypothetical protein